MDETDDLVLLVHARFLYTQVTVVITMFQHHVTSIHIHIHNVPRLVASGTLSLPDRSKSVIDSFTATDTYVNEHGDFSIECLWGTDELPTAVLRITSPGQMAYTWCKVLPHGCCMVIT